MVVGCLHVEFHVPDSHSLKDRRSVVKSLKERIRSRFGVAVAEVSETEHWQRAALGVAAVSGQRAEVERLLQEIVRWLREDRFVAVIHIEQELW